MPGPADAAGTAAPSRGSRRWTAVALLVGAAVLVIAPFLGSVPIPAEVVVGVLLRDATGGLLGSGTCSATGISDRLCGVYAQILGTERLPEIGLALLAGAALGLSGATLQGVFRNPLADPYLLGLSTGGTLGATVLLTFNYGIADADLLLPLFAFAGALLTGVAILLAARGPRGSVETLLLTGVALGSFLAAVLSLILLYNPYGSLPVSYWLLGGVTGATWDRDGIVTGGLLVGGGLIFLEARSLNVLQLGPEVAQSLGVDVPRTRVRLLFLASFVTALAVAFTGVIGFVGLVAPHIVRRLGGVDYRRVLPGAAVVGAVFLLAARDLADGAVQGTLLPVGIFTSFAGAPFFLYLLYRHRQASGIGGP